MSESILYEHSSSEPKTLSDVLLVEVNRGWTRQEVTVAASSVDLPIGSVLALDVDSGAYVPYLQAAGNSEASAILAKAVASSPAAKKAIVIRRGAVVAANALVFLSGVTDEQKITAYGQLTALGVVVEE